MTNKIEYMKFASDYKFIEQFLRETSECMTVGVDAMAYGFNTYKWFIFEFYLGLGDNNNEVNKFIERLKDEY